MSRETVIGEKSAKPLMLVFLGAAALGVALVVATVALGTDTKTLFWTNRDFANYWIASRLTLSGAVLDLFRGHEVYFPHMQAAFGADYPWHSWSYPPHYVFLILPFGALPYLPSAVVFELATLALFLHAVSLTAQQTRRATALLLLPAILCNIMTVQNGFLTSALMLYGLALRDSRPVLAGIAIGLLTVKPQLGLLLPVLLLYERRWKVIGVATATTLVLVAASAFAFGVEAWTGYIRNTWPYQVLVMREIVGVFLHMMPSTFGAMRSLGFDADTANLAHMPVAAVAFAVFIWSLFHLKDVRARSFSLLFAIFVISPYSVVYDLPALCAAAAIAAMDKEQTRSGIALQLLVLVCIVPLLGFALSLQGMPIAPLVLAAGWAAFLSGEGRELETSSPTPASPAPPPKA